MWVRLANLNSQRNYKDFRSSKYMAVKKQGYKTIHMEQPSPLVRYRLDYFLIQNKYQKIATSAKTIPGIKSDYKIIKLTLNLNKNN